MSALKMAPARPPPPQGGAGRATEVVSICKGEVARCNAAMGDLSGRLEELSPPRSRSKPLDRLGPCD